jgi:cyclophilin family peptidyl-prolyl cis-trans isomerase/protein-disulfide isomerase
VKINKTFMMIVVAGILLAACSPQAAAAPTASAATPQAVITESGPATCSAVSVLPTPGPTEASMFPPPSEKDWIIGPDSAVVTFTEYSDFQCPYCANFAPVLEQVQKENPDKVRVVFRHFPLPGHPNALITAQAAEAAGLQGKFWEMHDVIFEKQAEWSQLANPDAQAWLIARAGELGLDVAKFTTDLTSEALVNKAAEAQTNGRTVGIPGTPFLLINGKPYQGPRDIESLTSFIKLVDIIPRQFTKCPEMTIDPSKTYLAVLTTDKGDIVIELYPDIAPMAVNSFIFLAREGWFNGVTFHRVLADFVAQTGDPTGTGFGGPGYYFDNEISPELSFDQPGMVGMANSGPGSNGSQFFITYTAVPELTGNYTVFGKVVVGLETAQKLTPRDPSTGGNLPDGDKILKVTIQEK